MSVYCTSCGSPLAPAARFCSACGTVASVAPPPGGAPFAGPPPRLLRPVIGRQFAGVCAAFARSYGWDIALLRILAVVLGIFVFPVTEIFYIAAWIAIPDEATAPVQPNSPY